MPVARILNSIVEGMGLFLQNSEWSRRPAATEPMNSIQEGDVHRSEPTSRIRPIIEASEKKDRQRDHYRENSYKRPKPRDKQCNHNFALINNDREF